MSATSRESSCLSAIRHNSACARLLRCGSSACQLLNAPRRRAATCGLRWSRSSATSATKRKPSPSARLNCVWLPLAKAPISARTRLGLVSEKAGRLHQRGARAPASRPPEFAPAESSHLSSTSGSSWYMRWKRSSASSRCRRCRKAERRQGRELVGHVVGLVRIDRWHARALPSRRRRRQGRA